VFGRQPSSSNEAAAASSKQAAPHRFVAVARAAGSRRRLEQLRARAARPEPPAVPGFGGTAGQALDPRRQFLARSDRAKRRENSGAVTRHGGGRSPRYVHPRQLQPEAEVGVLTGSGRSGRSRPRARNACGGMIAQLRRSGRNAVPSRSASPLAHRRRRARSRATAVGRIATSLRRGQHSLWGFGADRKRWRKGSGTDRAQGYASRKNEPITARRSRRHCCSV